LCHAVVVFCHWKRRVMGRFILRAHGHNMTNGEFALFTLFPMQASVTDTPWFAYGGKDSARIRPAFHAIKQVRAQFSTNYRGLSFCGFCTFGGYTVPLIRHETLFYF